jgi:hypothetical protein
LPLPDIAPNASLLDDVLLSQEDEETTELVGLKKNLNPAKTGSSAPQGNDNVELFLKRVEEEVLNQAFAYQQHQFKSKCSRDIRSLSSRLQQQPTLVVVPTDKTNTFRVIHLAKYIDQMQGHLRANAKPIPSARLTEVVEEAMSLLNDITPMLSANERLYLSASIKSRAIPTPKLFIKDH